MSDDHSYWNAISADLDNDRPRLAYAQWLTSQGDSRGEFIRVQCEQAALHRPFAWNRHPRWTMPIPRSGEVYDRFYELSEHREQLVTEHLNEWTKPLAELGCVASPGTFERGLVERVQIAAERFPAVAEALFRLAPALRRLSTRGGVSHATFESLVGSPGMKRIITLESYGNNLDARAMEALVKVGNVENLQELLLKGPIGDPGAILLAGNPKLAKLKRLSLRKCMIGNIGFAALVTSPHLRNLIELDVSENGIHDLSLAIASSAGPRLQVLNLSSNRLDEKELRVYLRSPQLSGLRTLDVSYTSPAEGANFLDGCAFRDSLRELYLSGLRLGPASAAALSRVEFRALELLDVSSSELGELGFAALANSPVLAQLCTLRMGSSGIDDRAMGHLVRSVPFSRLWCLHLDENWIGEVGVRLLASAPWMAAVRELVLNRNQIGNDGLAALASSRHLCPSTLLLDRNQIGGDGVRALAASPWLGKVRSLTLYENDLEEDSLRELARAPHLRKQVAASLA